MHGLEYRAVKDVTFDAAEDCLRLLAVILNEGKEVRHGRKES
jgi:hypothetical protein